MNTLITIISVICFCTIGGILYQSIKNKAQNENIYDEENLDNIIINSRIAKKNIIIYIIIFFILSSIIGVFILKIYLTSKGIDPALIDSNSEFFNKEIYDNVLADVNVILQLIIYITALFTVGYSSLKWLINDFKKMDFKVFKYGIIGLGLLLLASIIGSMFLQLIGLSNESTNQEAITNLMKTGSFGIISTCFFTMICAPIVEELVFRKSIFTLLKKNITAAILVSSLCFGLLHVISPTIDAITKLIEGSGDAQSIFTEFIYIVPYALMGGALSFVYIKSDYNIYAAIFAHFLNNTLSCISLLLLSK